MDDDSGMDITFGSESGVGLEDTGVSAVSMEDLDDSYVSIDMSAFGLTRLDTLDVETVRAELRAAVKEQTERCLFDSAKWYVVY